MIAFIGTGKVGTSLCKYFLENNLKISGIFDSDIHSARQSAEFLNVKLYSTMFPLIDNSKIIFLTTNDANIPVVWDLINKKSYQNKIFIHCSGSLSSRIIKSKNNFAYSLHPMFPFSDKFNTYNKLENSYFSLEGDKEKLNYIKHIIESLGNTVLLISHENKEKYHLANVMVSNLVLSLLNKGCEYLEDCGITSTDAKEALIPLIKTNIDNICSKDFTEAVTGPVERNDIITVKKHLDVLNKEDINLYNNLSTNLVKIAKEKNKDRDYSVLVEILGSGN